MNNTLKTILFFIIIFFNFGIYTISVLAVDANRIYFLPNKTEINKGEEFLLSIELETYQNINAIEGNVIFDTKYLYLKELREGGSAINFWVDKPHLYSDGNVVFSGITPNGFSGKNNIYTIVFEARLSGNTNISFKNIKVLKNDGEGSLLDLDSKNINLDILPSVGVFKKEEIIDTEMPEDFLPIVGQDIEIYEGQKFLVFSTVDKGSGIDHFEIKEGRYGEYKEVTSPYLLENQKLTKNIYVKAVDKKGNTRVVVFDPNADGYKWYKNPFIFVIILLLLSLVFYVRKNLWKFIKKHTLRFW